MNFNESFYLARNPDIAIAVNQGLIGTGWQHYLPYLGEIALNLDAVESQIQADTFSVTSDGVVSFQAVE